MNKLLNFLHNFNAELDAENQSLLFAQLGRAKNINNVEYSLHYDHSTGYLYISLYEGDNPLCLQNETMEILAYLNSDIIPQKMIDDACLSISVYRGDYEIPSDDEMDAMYQDYIANYGEMLDSKYINRAFN